MITTFLQKNSIELSPVLELLPQIWLDIVEPHEQLLNYQHQPALPDHHGTAVCLYESVAD
jgi:hypothetical protein